MITEINFGNPIIGDRYMTFSPKKIKRALKDEVFANFWSTCQKELDNLILKTNNQKTTVSKLNSCPTDSRYVHPKIYLPVTELNSNQAEMLLACLHSEYLDTNKFAGDYFILQECYIMRESFKENGIKGIPFSFINPITFIKAWFGIEVKDENLKKVYVLKTKSIRY